MRGLAGRVAHAFIDSRLTPLIIVASLLIGLFAVAKTPREEEPQIVVPLESKFAYALARQGVRREIAVYATLQKELETLVAADKPYVVLDCGGLEYISSAGLRVLLAILKEARQHGGDLRLAAVQEKVYRILDLSGFTSIIKCYPDVAAAVASFTP